MGTWIETPVNLILCNMQKPVVPLVGTWIETVMANKGYTLNAVVPLVGTWLETACQLSLKMIQYIIPLAEI